ncbi:MAG: hypothetical protein CMO80_12970 [Verrucomicrobiales bacterium]|nr:hypothetical protein [Verrucomicrobiales bacterium]|tara:strand:+ start:1103 stop:1729 length:627 start_codon:yes stop_codon:yes gene_type:complete
MKKILTLTIALSVSSFTLQAGEKGFQRIFDGKTFKGWEGDTKKSFRIENGAVVGGQLKERIPRNEFLATMRRYTNFVLRLQVKLVGDKKPNAGIQIRTERIPNHHEVIGYQADMGPGWWGALYDESRRRKVLARPAKDVIGKALKEGWNDYEIDCRGKRIRLKINGAKTVDYTEPEDAIPQFGIIALQIHSGAPTEAWYRNIRIKELP